MSLKSLIRRKVFNSSRQIISARHFTTEDNIVTSPVQDVKIPKVLIQDYLFRKLDQWPDRIAAECVDTNRKYSYGEVYEFSKNLAGFTQKYGLRKGDTVAIILPNVPEYLIAIVGLMQAGIIITPINPIYTADEIVRQLQGSKAKLAITTSTLHPIVRQAADATTNLNFEILTISHTQNESIPAGSFNFHEICRKSYEFKDPNSSLDDLAILPYSSGTTGLPKGVQLTHRNILSNLAQGATKEFTMTVETDDKQQDVVPIVLPMFHIYGLSTIALTMFARGVKMITVPKFSTQVFLKIFKNYNPNLLYCVPPMILMLLNNPEFKLENNGSLRAILCGAAPLGSADIHRFNEKCNNKISLLQIYGMTECSPMSHHQTPFLDHGIKIGGSGFAVPNTLCKIVDINDSKCKGLGPNKQGELLIKGPQVMKGYLNNPEANKNVFVDGWLRTGDIAYYDNENHFYITDRLKELIKVSGFQVAPAELEELLRDHPLIEDAAVVGIPDERCGEAPKAFVILKKEQKLSQEDIHKYINEKVVKYKRLTGGVKIVDAIPKTASGKILRRELKNM